MGRNAQRRRDGKHARRIAVQLTENRRGDTVTLRRLRVKMREVATLSQFEEMIAAGDPTTRVARRRLLEPMLRAGLPCCGPSALAARLGKTLLVGQHTLHCPTRNKVTLTDETTYQMGLR